MADHRNAAEIEAQISKVRDEIGRTLDALEHKLAPRQLLEQGLDMVRNSIEGSTAGLGDVLRANPVPAALIGVGIGWLLWSSSGGGLRETRTGTAVRRRVQQAAELVEDGAAAAADSVRSAAAEVAAKAEALVDQLGQMVGVHGSNAQETGKTYSDVRTVSGTGSSRPSGYGSEQFQAEGHATNATSSGGLRKIADTVQHYASDYAEAASGTVRDLGRNADQVIESHPLMLGGIAALAGALFALSLPPTRSEDNLFGTARDSLRDRAVAEGKDALGRLEGAASEAASAAFAKAREGLVEAASPGGGQQG